MNGFRDSGSVKNVDNASLPIPGIQAIFKAALSKPKEYNIRSDRAALWDVANCHFAIPKVDKTPARLAQLKDISILPRVKDLKFHYQIVLQIYVQITQLAAGQHAVFH